MTTIKYKGKEYPLFEVVVKDFWGNGEDLVSYAAHEALEEKLISPNGDFVDGEAEAIDREIVFYVNNSVTTDEEAQKIVNENLF